MTTGATIVNQAEADRDISKLLATPAVVRFVSIEPMLGPINLDHIGRYTNGSMNMDALRGSVTNGILAMSARECSSMVTTTFRNPRIDWVIAGGESGPHARAAHPDWFRSLRDQCAGAGVPFLFTQWGEWRPPAEDEVFDTSLGRAQQIPSFIVAPTGTVHCFENERTRQGGAVMQRVGKKAAGRLLDGVEHLSFPKPCGNRLDHIVQVRDTEAVLVLLCHKRSLVFTRRQHGHRGSVLSKAAAINSRKVVMDDWTWRCVRWAATRLVMRG